MDSVLTLLNAALDWLILFGGVFLFLINCVVTAHVILYKENTRAATGWIGLIWLSPLAGHILYFLLGINRIERRAKRTYGRVVHPEDEKLFPKNVVETYKGTVQPASLARIVDRVSHRELTAGNSVEPLVNGKDAFPAMLEAIEQAERSITLCSYIFDNDALGQQFVSALSEAVNRGVHVRVLIDDVGARQSFPTITRSLKDAGVPVARFMQTWLPWKLRYLNLRNHRKILVVDGTVGFTGGLNISGDYVHDEPGSSPRDLHFRLEGPVVHHLQNTFSQDWSFTTGEELDGPPWYADLSPAGSVPARGIAAGPDETYDNLRLSFLGALSAARESVKIITPYFLPDDELISAMHIASLRDIRIDVFVPQEIDPRLVQWASQATLEQVLKYDCNVYLTPPPFDHTKLMVVDDRWVCFGSTNWDPRSLKLNFEFNVECYDADLARRVQPLFDQRTQEEKKLTRPDLINRPLPERLRDGAVRLLTPYL